MKEATNSLLVSFGVGIHRLPQETYYWLYTVFHESLSFLNLSHKQITLYFCSIQQIQELNKHFRNKNQPTDILSWSYDLDFCSDQKEEQLWGELAICLAICRKQAKKYNLTLQEELTRLFIHGLTHLQGFDHITEKEEKEMLYEEKKLLSLFSISYLYDKSIE